MANGLVADEEEIVDVCLWRLLGGDATDGT
jgi:hypothetical protein